MTRRRTTRATLASTALLALVLGACGGDTEEDPAGQSPEQGGGDAAGSVQADEELAGMVPDDIREAGTLTIGTDPSYAPNEYLDEDGSTIIGMDIDLFDAVAATLDLETEYQSADFGTIIAGVTGGKYDAGVSSFTINEERKEQVTMVSYFNAGTQWAVAAGNPENVDPQQPCGLTVAVQTDTVQFEEDLPPKEEACEEEGNPMTVQPYTGQDEATAALVSGKADAMLADSPVIAYAVQQTGDQIEPVGDIYDSAPYGYVLPTEDEQLAEAIVGALEKLAEDGTYEQILSDWGLQDGAIDDFAVNP